MKLFLLLFLSLKCKNNNLNNKLMFELGNNNNIIRRNKNETVINNELKNNDAALIPLKDLPKHKPLW